MKRFSSLVRGLALSLPCSAERGRGKRLVRGKRNDTLWPLFQDDGRKPGEVNCGGRSARDEGAVPGTPCDGSGRARLNGPLRVSGLALACVLMLPACRHAPVAETPAVGSVGVSLVTPPAGATRMQLDASQAFVFPNLVDPVAMPAYPQDLLPLRLAPVELCVDVTISGEGLVSEATRRVDDDCPDPADAHAARFADAVLEAVRAWTYDPALVCRTPDGRPSADACAEADAVETPTALRLSYAFVFTQEDGRPSVRLREGMPAGQ